MSEKHQKIREEFVNKLFPKWWLSPACKNPGQPLQEPLPYYRLKKHGRIFLAEILAFPPSPGVESALSEPCHQAPKCIFTSWPDPRDPLRLANARGRLSLGAVATPAPTTT